MWTHFFSNTDYLYSSTLTRIAQNDFYPHNVYAYFLCGFMCTWTHESDAELICMLFFFLRRFNILCYASGFYYAIVLSTDVFDARGCARARVYV